MDKNLKTHKEEIILKVIYKIIYLNPSPTKKKLKPFI
jgi:hypothetical protein